MAHVAPPRTERAWLVVASVLCVAGFLGALIGASAVARSSADRSRRQFESTGRQIGARLQLALEHEADLVTTAKAYVSRNADVRTTEFVAWANDEEALERYPELTALGLIRLVPAAELAAFASSVQQDPLNEISSAGSFQPLPSGDRAYYCFVAAGAAERTHIPNNYDFCAGGGGSGILHARDTGFGSYEPVKGPGTTFLGVEEPVYMGGAVPATVEERQQQFVGWVGMVIQPAQLLHAAAPDVPVRMHYHRFGSDVAFARGRPATNAETFRVQLG